MANLTNVWRNEIYNLVALAAAPNALTALYLRLHDADPTAAGSFADEITGGSYTGKRVDNIMGAPTNGVGTNGTQVDFTGMPASTVSHWSICKSAAGTVDGDEMVQYGAFGSPIIVGAGATFSVLVGDLDVTVT